MDNTALLEQINYKLDLLLVTSTPDEWLTPQDAQRIFKWGKTHFWNLVNRQAFPVSRPMSENATKSRAILIKRSDVEAYLRKHSNAH